jgi:hypothetical protein
MQANLPNQSSLPGQDLQKLNRQMESALSDIRRTWRYTYRTFYSRTYQLPQNDEPQYPKHAYAFGWDTFITAAILTRCGVGQVDDAGQEACFRATNAWASLGKATLFLERDLAEALLRTDLPEGFGPEDIQWRREAFRLFLPRGLFIVGSEQGRLEPTCLTAVHFRPGVEIPLPDGVQQDVRALVKRSGRRDLDGSLTLRQNVDELLICLQMRPTPESKGADIFFASCVLDERSLSQIAKDSLPMANCAAFNLSELDFMTAIRRLVFNVILFTASVPIEYEPEVLRPTSVRRGNEFYPSLVRAKFLGQELYRPASRPARETQEPTGRKLSGHWRRQPCGEGNLQRKLIWIQPYKTARSDADQADGAKSNAGGWKADAPCGSFPYA